MPVILVTGIIIIVTLLYIHFTKHNDDWIEKEVAGPEPNFFFGNVEDAVLRRKHIGEIIKEIYDAYPEENVLGIFVMRNPELLVRDLDIVKNILIEDCDVFVIRGYEFEKSDVRAEFLHGAGTLGTQNIFSQLFSSENLQNVINLANERGDAFVEFVNRITQLKQKQDVHVLVQKYTKATVTACAFGVNLDTFTKEDETLLTINRNAFTLNFGRELEMMYPDILKKLGHFLDKRSPFSCNLVKNILYKQRNGEPRNKDDLMNLILKLKKEGDNLDPKRNIIDITDETIAAQAYSFYTAAYETTASILAFLLYQLALNPDIQDKVVAEIKQMLEKHNGEITLHGVLDLAYMGKVIDETLRMYPVIPELRRKSKRAYKIPGTNLTVEKNQWIRISALSIHYDEKIYPNPGVFDPARFSTEKVDIRHACSYLPFGIGPRHCMGTNFAQVLSRVCLVKLLSQFRVEASEKTPPHIQYDPTRSVLCPKGSLPINLVKRKAF